MIFRQLFESTSSTYTYIIADEKTREALIIDPVKQTFDRDMQLLNEMHLELKYILETHIHADHITSSGPMREKTKAKILLGKATELPTADHLLEDGETFKLSSLTIKTILTPGHTDGCTSYHIEDRVFTGDTLFIRGCGRTDFQQGNSSTLFHSVREKLFKLPDNTLIYPGHDYKGRTSSSIAEEKEFNPRLNLKKSETEFIEIMQNLKLDKPKQIDIAVPANLKSGLG